MDTKREKKKSLITKREVMEWSDEKRLQFLKFVDFFTVDGAFKFTMERIGEARMRDDTCWQEFLGKVGVFPGIHDGWKKKFGPRFLVFSRVPLAYFKQNPHVVSPEMFAIMQANPRMQWAANNFKTVETESGVVVVEREMDDTLDPGRRNAAPDVTRTSHPEVIFNEAVMKLATLTNDLLKNIGRDELKKMDAAKRISLANQSLGVLSQIVRKNRPNVAVFKQINIGKGKREEMEEAIRTYAESGL